MLEDSFKIKRIVNIDEFMLTCTKYYTERSEELPSPYTVTDLIARLYRNLFNSGVSTDSFQDLFYKLDSKMYLCIVVKKSLVVFEVDFSYSLLKEDESCYASNAVNLVFPSRLNVHKAVLVYLLENMEIESTYIVCKSILLSLIGLSSVVFTSNDNFRDYLLRVLSRLTELKAFSNDLRIPDDYDNTATISDMREVRARFKVGSSKCAKSLFALISSSIERNIGVALVNGLVDTAMDFMVGVDSQLELLLNRLVKERTDGQAVVAFLLSLEDLSSKVMNDCNSVFTSDVTVIEPSQDTQRTSSISIPVEDCTYSKEEILEGYLSVTRSGNLVMCTYKDSMDIGVYYQIADNKYAKLVS